MFSNSGTHYWRRSDERNISFFARGNYLWIYGVHRERFMWIYYGFMSDAVWNDDDDNDGRDDTQTASGRVKILYCQDKNETLDK